MDIAKFKDILYDKDDEGIVTVCFNNPAKKNSVTGRSLLEFWWAGEHFHNDDTAYAMIITGTDNVGDKPLEKNAFCAGANFSAPPDFSDLSEAEKAPYNPRDIAQKNIVLRYNLIDKPIIVAMNGYGIGFGTTMPLSSADFIYMADTAWFRMPFLALGIVPELASTYLLPRQLGIHKANEVLMLGNDISAQQAYEMGLCNGICPHNEVVAMARATARKLIPPNAAFYGVRRTKAAVRAAMVDELTAALDRENEALNACFKSNDFKEALMARMQKRTPQFTGS